MKYFLFSSRTLGQDDHFDSYLGVSENSGTPKSSILIGFSIINHPFWGTSIFGNTHFSIRVETTNYIAMICLEGAAKYLGFVSIDWLDNCPGLEREHFLLKMGDSFHLYSYVCLGICLVILYLYWLVVSNVFIFTPNFGEDYHFD